MLNTILNTIIVDDELTAIHALKEEIKHYCPNLNIIAECDGVKDAIKKIDSMKPALVFLDIHLGDGTGFNVLEQTTWKDYKVIFTTAYDNYAINAFKVNAVDYLLKPISGVELQAAVIKVCPERPAAVKNITNESRLAIQHSKGVSLYNIADIIRIEAKSNYSWIYCIDGEKILASKTLKEFEDNLTTLGFIRIHHAHLINIAHLRKVYTKDCLQVEMSNSQLVPVSQRKKHLLLPLIAKMKI